MKTCRLILYLSILVLAHVAQATPQQGPITRIRLSKSFQTDESCRALLGHVKPAVENGLQQLNARRASAYLGLFEELEDLLTEAGVSSNRAKKMVDAVYEMHRFAFASPLLQFSAGQFDSLIRNREILLCVLSTNCSIANTSANNVFFSGFGKEAILLLPPPKVSPADFAINLMGTFSSLSAERFLMAWMRRGYTLESRRSGSADKFYRRYVSPAYKGELPPVFGSLDEGFAATFMTLYQTYETLELHSLKFPERSSINRIHLAKTTFSDLSRGRNSFLTEKIVEQLEINEENFFSKTIELLKAMEETMVKASEDSE